MSELNANDRDAWPLLAAARHGAYLGLKWVTIIIGSVIVIFWLITSGYLMYLVVFRDSWSILIDRGFQKKYLLT